VNVELAEFLTAHLDEDERTAHPDYRSA